MSGARWHCQCCSQFLSARARSNHNGCADNVSERPSAWHGTVPCPSFCPARHVVLERSPRPPLFCPPIAHFPGCLKYSVGASSPLGECCGRLLCPAPYLVGQEAWPHFAASCAGQGKSFLFPSLKRSFLLETEPACDAPDAVAGGYWPAIRTPELILACQKQLLLQSQSRTYNCSCCLIHKYMNPAQPLSPLWRLQWDLYTPHFTLSSPLHGVESVMCEVWSAECEVCSVEFEVVECPSCCDARFRKYGV